MPDLVASVEACRRSKHVVSASPCVICSLHTRCPVTCHDIPCFVARALWIERVSTSISIIGWSCHKCNFCRDKHATKVLPREREKLKRFVETKRLSQQIFVATNIILSRLAYFCHDKHGFVATKVCLSRQNICSDTHVFNVTTFVATSILLSRQKTCFVVTNTCLSRQSVCCN